MKRLLTALFTALSLLSQGAYAQDKFKSEDLEKNYEAYVCLCSPEKLFLHLDRTYFASGESIWFNGYLKNASNKSHDEESNYIYVELLDSKLNVRCRVKIRRDLPKPKVNKPKNAAEQFLALTSAPPPPPDRRGTAFPGKLEIPETLPSGVYTLRAYTLYQMNNAPEFMFNQQIRIFNSKGKKPAEQNSVQENPKIDISFYPEGGRYFTGIRSRIAFKIMDSEGRSANLIVSLRDEQGKLIRWTTTLHDGMGCIDFTPEEGVRYHLETIDGQKFDIPAPASEGATIALFPSEDELNISVKACGKGSYILVHRDADKLTRLAEIKLTDKVRNFRIGMDNFKPGINHIILLNDTGMIVSERLFFVDDPKALKCKIEQLSGRPEKRSVTRVTLALSDTSRARASVAVVRSAFKNFRQSDDIVSYMRLSSELKGKINDPSFYFDDNIAPNSRRKMLDLLMMVQGWRYYDLDSIVQSRMKMGAYKREYMQSVSGTITRRLSKNKIPKNFLFSVIIPKIKFSAFQQVGEGRSYTVEEIEFEENTGFFIKAQRPGMSFDYLPKWDGDTFAVPFPYRVPAGESSFDPSQTFAYDVSADTLQAAVVTATQGSAFNAGAFGSTVSQNDLEAYSTRTLIDYLSMRVPAFEYNGETMRNRRFGRGGFAGPVSLDISEDIGSQHVDDAIEFAEENTRGEVKLVVEGMEDNWRMFEQVQLSEIESISYTTEPDPVFHAEGGAVYVKFRTGYSAKNAQMDDAVLYFVPLGYQTASKFYSPRYDRGDEVPGYDGFDHRNTVYWSPDRKISNGRAEFTFCTTDTNDFPYYVVVQGITDDGRPFSALKTLY